jgi:diadenosine tetraphosphatase ApaH/serine/threonine PP2A family protein phosphatase
VKAILSDVHANLEALRAVLDDIDRRQIEAIYNLGDTTGYGPNPIECLDLAMSMSVVLLGTFDHAVLFQPRGFGVSAEESILWTQRVLKSFGDGPAPNPYVNYLAGLSPDRREKDAKYVHGSPVEPLNGWVFADDVRDSDRSALLGQFPEDLCFNGHTHRPGLFVENGPGEWQSIPPDACRGGFRLDGRKVICNVGSVGQPRDGDWRAGYVLFDGIGIRFVRIEYDIETTIRKIHEEPALRGFSA